MDGLADLRVVEVQIRLVGIEAVPVIGPGVRVPGPVGGFKILEDDSRFGETLRSVAPDVEIAPATSRLGAARALKPGMLIGGMVQNQFGDDPQPAPMRLFQKALKSFSVP